MIIESLGALHLIVILRELIEMSKGLNIIITENI